MERYLLSDIFALSTFIPTFWPLARRAGRGTRIALLGWAFLLVHYLALFAGAVLYGVSPSIIPHATIALTSLAAIQLCALCFLRGAADPGFGPLEDIMLAEASFGILLQSLLVILGISSGRLLLLPLLILLIPVTHLVAKPAHRTRTSIQLAALSALLALVSILPQIRYTFPWPPASCLVLFATAGVYSLVTSPAFRPGALVTSAGLFLWSISYPLGMLLPAGHLPALVLAEFPQFCVACGMILSMLHHQLTRAEQLALADPLTGLANTRHFEQRFARASQNSALDGGRLACLVIDIDHFKQINDTLGHPVGDELLKVVAARLAWHIGPRDTLARTGGDEFIALLVSRDDDHHLYFIARAMMAAVSCPVFIHGHSVAVTMSVGMALSGNGEDGLVMLRKAADDAMYRAKRNGGGQLVVADQAI